jgi:uncharacterized membrane protein YeiH
VTDLDFRVPLIFDYAATFAWAISGAMIGIRKQFDLTGVFVIALLSAAGGGLMRDAVFLQRTPAFLRDPIYLPLIAATTPLVALFTGPITRMLKGQTVSKIVEIIDGLGTPAFAVIGMQLAQDAKLPLFAVVLVGVVNGTAGGLLRDVVVRDVPTLLRPGQFISLALAIACGLFVALREYYHVDPTPAAEATVATFFVIRVAAVRFNWQTRALAQASATSEIEDGSGPRSGGV